MNFNLKDLNELRCSRRIEKKNTIKFKSNLIYFIEIPAFLSRSSWDNNQFILLNYLANEILNLTNKNIILFQDSIGIYSIIIFSMISTNIILCEEHIYSSIVFNNFKLNQLDYPHIYTLDTINIVNSKKDYIFICNEINEVTFKDFKKLLDNIDVIVDIDTKIILFIHQLSLKSTINKLDHFSNIYSRIQLTPYRSKSYILFEMKKRNISWLERN